MKENKEKEISKQIDKVSGGGRNPQTGAKRPKKKKAIKIANDILPGEK